MKKVFLLLYCLMISSSLAAQLKLGSNTSIKSGSQAIITTGMTINNNSALVSFPFLQLENNATINTSQDMLIAGGLTLYSGKISFTGEGKVLYSGSADNLFYDENNYIISGFYTKGTGFRNYPVGTLNELADANLIINGDDPDVIISMNVLYEDPGLAQLPSGVDHASFNWYWQMKAEGNFESVIPALSINNPDNILLATADENSTFIILEANERRDAVKNLGRTASSTAEYVQALQGGVGPYFLLGVTKDVPLVINQIITPDNDGINDYLEVQNLDVFAGNYEVMLIDRLGALVWSSKRLHEGNINFNFLAPGNYVCIVNYAGNTAKQMVTVLK